MGGDRGEWHWVNMIEQEVVEEGERWGGGG